MSSELKPCPNPHCNAETLPKYRSTGVDCMTQFNHIVSCECGVSVCGMSRKEVFSDWNDIPRLDDAAELVEALREIKDDIEDCDECRCDGVLEIARAALAKWGK